MLLKKLKAFLGESALQARARIIQVLRAEEIAFGKLITERATADAELVRAETGVLLSEQADAVAAREKADGVMVAIARQALRLAGLRSRLAEQGVELEAERLAIKATMPSLVGALRADFVKDWEAGILAFGYLLGKRLATEAVIGQLNLPQPVSIPCELEASVLAPWRSLEGITAALDEIAGWSNASQYPEIDAGYPGAHKPYNPAAVYVLIHPTTGLEGTLVMDASFAPGTLGHYVEIGYAVPLSSRDWSNSLQAGRQARLNISAEDNQQRIQADQRPVADTRSHIRKPGKEWDGGSAVEHRPTN